MRPLLMKSRVSAGLEEGVGNVSCGASTDGFAKGGSGAGGVQFATEVELATSKWLYSGVTFSGATLADIAGAGFVASGFGSRFTAEEGMPIGAGNSSYSGVLLTTVVLGIGGGWNAGTGRGGEGVTTGGGAGASRWTGGTTGGAAAKDGADGALGAGGGATEGVGAPPSPPSWCMPQKSFTGSI